MQKILSILTIFLVTTSVYAECTPELFSQGALPITTYKGTMKNKYPIALALTVSKTGDVEGRYAYLNSQTTIQLKGTLNKNSIQLTEFDQNHVPSAIFDGKFLNHDPRGFFNPNKTLHCEVIEGRWKNIQSDQSYPFYINLKYKTAGPLNNLYAIAGAKSEDAINQSSIALRQAIIKNNRTIVSSLMDYPVAIHFSGQKKLLIANQSQLLAHYNEIFTEAMKQAISNEIPLLLFVMDNGATLGDGLVWFNDKGKIFSINVKQ